MKKHLINSAWLVFGLFALIQIIAGFDRQIMSPLMTPVKESLHLTDQQVARATLAFTYTTLLITPIIGFLGDRYRRKPFIIAGLIFWSLAAAGSGLAGGLVSLIIWRSLVGAGEGLLGGITTSWLADTFPPNRRAFVFALLSSIGPTGYGLAFILGSAIAEGYGWRNAFLISGIPGILLAIFLFFVREPERGESEDPGIEPPRRPTLGDVGHLLRRPTYLLFVLAGTLFYFGLSGASFWGSTYFHREFGVTNRAAADFWGYSYLIYGFLGALIGGFIGMQFRKIGLAGYALAGGLFALVCFASAVPGLLATTYFSAEFWFSIKILSACALGGVKIPLLLQIVPAELRGTATAIEAATASVVATLLKTEVLGYLSDQYGLARAMWLIPLTFLLSIPVWGALSFLLFRQHARVQKDLVPLREELPVVSV